MNQAQKQRPRPQRQRRGRGGPEEGDGDPRDLRAAVRPEPLRIHPDVPRRPR